VYIIDDCVVILNFFYMTLKNCVVAGGSHLFTPEVFLEDLKGLAAAPEEE
jgi:hypothetical protein